MNKIYSIRRLSAGLMLLTGLLAASFTCTAQDTTDHQPLYKKFPFVPSFKLLKADSSTFIMKEVIPRKSAAIVIIFSPTCSHCQHQAEAITSHMTLLKDITFLFVTGYPLDDMKRYISDYGLDKFPNVFVGQDRGQNLAGFYRVQGIPGIYIYNKKGNLVEEFSTNVAADKLVQSLQK